MQFHTFVSYAHLDDKPIAGEERGWVSTLVDDLKNQLDKHLGFSTIWKDEKLSGNDALTPTIMEALEQSETLLVILSRAYLNSEWCCREKNAFLQIAAGRLYEDRRIFIVEPLPLPHEDKPEEFREILGFKFWIQNREDKAPRTMGYPELISSDKPYYYDKLNELAFKLAKAINPPKELTNRQLEDTAAVFLAEVTDDLENERDEVKRYLDQAGINILPERSLYAHYISELDDLTSQLEQQIACSRCFVQLLSQHSGKRQLGQSSFPRLQYDAAVKMGIPILQWRIPSLLTNTSIVDDQRALLEGNTVLAVNLEEFKQEAKKLALTPKKIPAPEPDENVVFLDFSQADLDLAANIKRVIRERGFGLAMPLLEGKPKDIRKHLENWLQECSGVIIVYGAVPPIWVSEQLKQCNRVRAFRKHPLKAFAIFDGPPDKKTDFPVYLPGMVTLDGRNGLQEEQLLQFLNTLSAKDDL